MAKYRGFYSVNHGQTHNGNTGYEYTSKAVAKASLTRIAKGSTPSGSFCNWWVKDEDGKIIMRGTVRK